ncbi:MAG: CDP-alcohol phosphatidyltransferase family protein [Anaerolineales bacterium]|nr:CDP-alcohol phosphatidyltransferase family protein [Anaerolineales bacterium]
MSEIKDHERVNDILLGPLERPALQWLAAHMPAWMTPDILTGIGTFGAVLIAVSYWLTNYSEWFLWFASLGFVINWFGDSLDGTLARFRKIERPKYGFFIDHTVDALNETIIFLGFGLSPYLRFEIACLALIGYLLMSVLVYVSTAVSGVFKISDGKLGPTEIRAIAILINVFIFFFGNPSINLPTGGTTVIDLAVLIIALALFLIFIGSSLQQARQLAKEDV